MNRWLEGLNMELDIRGHRRHPLRTSRCREKPSDLIDMRRGHPSRSLKLECFESSLRPFVGE